MTSTPDARSSARSVPRRLSCRPPHSPQCKRCGIQGIAREPGKGLSDILPSRIAKRSSGGPRQRPASQACFRGLILDEDGSGRGHSAAEVAADDQDTDVALPADDGLGFLTEETIRPKRQAAPAAAKQSSACEWAWRRSGFHFRSRRAVGQGRRSSRQEEKEGLSRRG